MLILVDNKAPAEAKANLKKLGELIEFSTEGLVYDSISGHPDIFITQSTAFNITAPNLPEFYKTLFKKHNIPYTEGCQTLGKTYPETALFNAVVTDKYFIHNLKISDEKLLQNVELKQKIHVSQGYTRCNLLPLNNEKMIASDRGIQTALKKAGIDVLHIQPEGIKLPGFKNGFIGGTCGIIGNTICFLGSLRYHGDGKKLEKFIRDAGFNIFELYDGPLFDGGGIFLFEN